MIFLTIAAIFDKVIKASEMRKPMKNKAVLVCQECLSRNYEIKKKPNAATRFSITKFCKKCNKHTLHKESK